MSYKVYYWVYADDIVNWITLMKIQQMVNTYLIDMVIFRIGFNSCMKTICFDLNYIEIVMITCMSQLLW